MSIRSVKRQPVKFVPAYAGNREDPNPLWVEIVPLSRKEMDAYTKRTRYFQRKGFRGEWDSNLLEIQRKQFLDNVVSVHNFLDADTDEEITSVERFYNEAPHPLIEEILDAIIDVSTVSETEAKNSN